jgi:hypothetical protein
VVHTVAEEVEGGRDAGLKAVLEEVLSRLAGVPIHFHKAHLTVGLRQILRHQQAIKSHDDAISIR